MSNVEWIYGYIRGETEHRNKLLKDKSEVYELFKGLFEHLLI